MLNRIRSLFGKPRPTVAVVPLHGAVMASGRFGRSFDDASLAQQLDAAFRAGGLAAVALAINCPGGSPVQCGLIGQRIRRLAEEKGVPVYAFCQDVAASGGYWIACAADEIYADDNSIVGSIGVISAAFGFHEAIAKLGIERRVHTAGESKSMWDPFRPEKEEDVARLKRIQEGMHASFIDWVRSRRAERLDPEAEVFTGDIWLGPQARELGLIDGVGHLVPVMKDKFGDTTRFRLYGRRRSFWERIGGPGVESVVDEIGVRAMYARYGL